MIGLDTNILVRYFAQDDSGSIAEGDDDHRKENEIPGLSALLPWWKRWVLERVYGLAPREIVATVEGMLQVDIFVVANEQHVFTAISALKDGRGSFADALIGAPGKRAGCSTTLTFDRKAMRLPEFKLV